MKMKQRKNRDLRSVIMMVLLILLIPDPGPSAQITLDSKDQFGFARYCMEQGEYYRAVGEFERFVFLFPDHERVPEAQYYIGVCYVLGGRYDSARSVLEEVYRKQSELPLSEKALFMMGEAYYRQGAFEEAEQYFRKVIDDHTQSELRGAVLYRLGWSRLKTDQWQDAAKIFLDIDQNSDLYNQSLILSTEALKGDTLPRKSPATAGIMAAVIPGMGHVYCGRPKDGLTAFLVNGLFIWAAVESFEHDQDVLGSVLTFLEVGWYTGNIYSAVNCAHKYNRKVKDDFRKGLSERMDLDLFTTSEGDLGLSMRVIF
ncbi:MAG: tetratricopeptide repeat protein [Deltaproteobacteria bacterium]|nr:tetratricopeptide repeat protein [Deltaproteobacteria bacterium]